MLALFAAIAACELPTVANTGFMKFMNDRVCHFECFNIVRQMERAVNDGKEADTIKSEIGKHCEKLSAPRNETCKKMVDSTDKVIGMLKEGKRPDFICDSLGYTRHFRLTTEIPKDKCVAVIDALKKRTHDTTFPRLPMGPKVLEDDEKKQIFKPIRGPLIPFARRFGVCKDFENPQDRMVCQIISRIAFHDMHKELEQGVESGAICDAMKEKGLVKFSE